MEPVSPPSRPGDERCGFCKQSTKGDDFRYGPVRTRGKLRYAHELCAKWAPGTYEKNGDLMMLVKEMNRGYTLKCRVCKLSGAVNGCYEPKCQKMYHFPCLQNLDGSYLDHNNFRCFCEVHNPNAIPHKEVRVTSSRPPRQKRKRRLMLSSTSKKMMKSGDDGDVKEQGVLVEETEHDDFQGIIKDIEGMKESMSIRNNKVIPEVKDIVDMTVSPPSPIDSIATSAVKIAAGQVVCPTPELDTLAAARPPPIPPTPLTPPTATPHTVHIDVFPVKSAIVTRSSTEKKLKSLDMMKNDTQPRKLKKGQSSTSDICVWTASKVDIFINFVKDYANEGENMKSGRLDWSDIHERRPSELEEYSKTQLMNKWSNMKSRGTSRVRNIVNSVHDPPRKKLKKQHGSKAWTDREVMILEEAVRHSHYKAGRVHWQSVMDFFSPAVHQYSQRQVITKWADMTRKRIAHGPISQQNGHPNGNSGHRSVTRSKTMLRSYWSKREISCLKDLQNTDNINIKNKWKRLSQEMTKRCGANRSAAAVKQKWRDISSNASHDSSYSSSDHDNEFESQYEMDSGSSYVSEDDDYVDDGQDLDEEDEFMIESDGELEVQEVQRKSKDDEKLKEKRKHKEDEKLRISPTLKEGEQLKLGDDEKDEEFKPEDDEQTQVEIHKGVNLMERPELLENILPPPLGPVETSAITVMNNALVVGPPPKEEKHIELINLCDSPKMDLTRDSDDDK